MSNYLNMPQGVQYSSYVVTVFIDGPDYQYLRTLSQYLTDSQDIIAYWNYIPHTFCVKTYLSSTDLRLKILSLLGVNKISLFIAKLDLSDINGQLPVHAWEWFYFDHSQTAKGKQVLPPSHRLPG